MNVSKLLVRLFLPTAVLLSNTRDVPAQETPEATGVVRGVLVKSDPAQITIRQNTGNSVNITVNEASRFEADGKPTKLAVFTPEQRVRATYVEKGAAKNLVLLQPAVTTDRELRQQLRRSFNATKQYTFQQKEEYVAEMNRAVDSLDDRIDQLEAEAQDAKADAKAKLQEQIAALKSNRAALRDRMEKARAATADAWGDLKQGVSGAADDLEKALDKLFKN